MSADPAERRMRVVVCGTIFGQVYLEAFRRGALPFELAGILSRGSELSRRCAAQHGVPLFTAPEQLPDDIDIACVVVRAGLLGGRGSALANALMERGIHVLQEHPLHGDELAACLRQARRHRVIYHLNSFYIHVGPVMRFIGAARELLRCQPPLYVDAECGFQMAYSLFDILGQALGAVRPWALSPAPPPPRELRGQTHLDAPFRSLEGLLARVPLTLRVQNQLDPSDPDNHAHRMHRVTLGTEGGSLTLVDTHGPTLWSPRPHFPRDARGREAQPHFSTSGGADGSAASAVPSVLALGPLDAPSYREIFGAVWSVGVRRALLELRRAILQGADPLRSGQYHLSLCELWQDVTERLGPPDLLRCAEPRPLAPAELAAMAKAADEADAMP